MKIIVEYAVPEDEDMHELIYELERDGDHPGLLEAAWCCPAYTCRVEE